MFDSILILQSPGIDFADLRQAFQTEVGAACDVRVVAGAKELLQRVADVAREHVVVLPQPRARRGVTDWQLIAKVRAANEETAVIVVADQGNVASAAEAVHAGANDFLVRGPQLGDRIRTLLGKLRSLFDVIDRKRQLDTVNTQLAESLQVRAQIIGRSAAMRKLLARIQRVAQIPRSVLILGERGTGKELVARAIHVAAGVATRPLITINCAAFSDALLESELFGHERGAFTGADSTRRGKFELADGGTLFLDEIGHMTRAFQQKILRVVEYGVFQRVGGSAELRTNARIVAATNMDLRERIRRDEFLADLYDRLAFEVLDVPPLRQRGADIELLAQHFLDDFARETPSFPRKTLSRLATAALHAHPFPGNVRELKNIIERAAYRDAAPEISVADLGLTNDGDLLRGAGSFDEKVDVFQRRLIEDALAQSGGNQAAAARHLGLSYHQFRYYLKKFSASRGPGPA